MPTVTELKNTDPLLYSLNRGLMIQWINAHIHTRFQHDIARSIVLYDKDRMFVTACHELPDADLLEQLAQDGTVQYWSKGIV